MIPNGKKLIYHNGWWHGNRTVFVRMLDEDATIIAFSNNDYVPVYSSKRLCDLFGDYHQLQSHETFGDEEPDPADSTGGNSALATAPVPDTVAKAPVVFSAEPATKGRHHVVHKRAVHYVKRKTPRKKTTQSQQAA